MGLSPAISSVISLTLGMSMFAVMQMFKQQLAATEYMTILGGLLGSIVFIFVLTGVSNLETSLFGGGFQTKLLPEVAFCLAMAMFASGLIHRVCVTTCFIFSLVALYYINKISQKVHAPVAVQSTGKSTPGKKKR
ncbi:keratinocyte-associated protein 2-like [Mytilus californianus]|uniref:keratinocyte-associated protein 2-like n=1 Tax=Mytilus californianus TaxID=6549 RepID=UPI002245238D|nr:keratinocyte-associated protein 2-like [Mytilus californianus]XP_052099993.1 keratinocyte-associated protein 2-like [Mytilus californianus]